ncbi:MAG: hypothetical protein A2W91_09575 [Bacteroidetes bacterium GWF2_38_335]|nr:MAG: hypothetical protein A2W91_09575 [Bacteroidetes bacterium GWF2_38_335]OFY80781.1 MAG: hypothetical protein A2281_09380 [Bacteroidetes bacterium RIFOXYA12_FULL_38_20]HBS86317.1 GNAT family N-acetyltransferase [Bacteroidales bacterium]
MQYKTKRFAVRPWNFDDCQDLAFYGNNKKIYDNLRDAFPYPYTLKNAENWLKLAPYEKNYLLRAIEIDGHAVGGIGAIFKDDVYRKSCEIGYWLAEQYWGRGIMTEIIKKLVKHIFEKHDVVRVYAAIFESNKASARVLEKAGLKLEAVHKKAVFKNGVFMDELMYAVVRLKNE